jgi:hypothetical protein
MCQWTLLTQYGRATARAFTVLIAVRPAMR